MKSELGTVKEPPTTLWGLSDNLPVKSDTHFDPENEGRVFLWAIGNTAQFPKSESVLTATTNIRAMPVQCNDKHNLYEKTYKNLLTDVYWHFSWDNQTDWLSTLLQNERHGNNTATSPSYPFILTHLVNPVKHSDYCTYTSFSINPLQHSSSAVVMEE